MNRTILVVDDDRTILTMLGTVLQDAGYQTCLVSNPLDAAAVAYAERPGLILLDLMMPSLTGEAVFNVLRDRLVTSRIPVVVVSAAPDVAARAKELGAKEFVAKPFMVDDLLAVIDRTLR